MSFSYLSNSLKMKLPGGFRSTLSRRPNSYAKDVSSTASPFETMFNVQAGDNEPFYS